MLGALVLAGLGTVLMSNPARRKKRKGRKAKSHRGAYHYRLAVTKAEAAIIRSARAGRMSKLQEARKLKRLTPVAQQYLPAAYQKVVINPRFTPMWLNKSEFDMVKGARSAAMRAIGARRGRKSASALESADVGYGEYSEDNPRVRFKSKRGWVMFTTRPRRSRR